MPIRHTLELEDCIRPTQSVMSSAQTNRRPDGDQKPEHPVLAVGLYSGNDQAQREPDIAAAATSAPLVTSLLGSQGATMAGAVAASTISTCSGASSGNIAKYATSLLRRNDVLFGRGRGPQLYDGNVAFHERINSLPAECFSGDKTLLARQMYESIVTARDGGPGGRFLKQAESTEAIQADIRSNKPVCWYDGKYWLEVPEKLAVDKCRAAIRTVARKKDTSRQGKRKSNESMTTAASTIEAEGGSVPVAQSVSRSPPNAISFSQQPCGRVEHGIASKVAETAASTTATAGPRVQLVSTSTLYTAAAQTLEPVHLDPQPATVAATAAVQKTLESIHVDAQPATVVAMAATTSSRDAAAAIPVAAAALKPATQAGVDTLDESFASSGLGIHNDQSVSADALPVSPRDRILHSNIQLALVSARECKQKQSLIAVANDGKENLAVLCAFGKKLYDLFVQLAPGHGPDDAVTSGTGKNGASDGLARPSKGSRRSVHDGISKQESTFTHLVELGYPVRLSTLVASLANQSESECFYHAISEVEHDLQQMLDDPDTYLYDTGSNMNYPQGQLQFPEDRLYGRKEDVDTLLSTYRRVIHTGEEPRHLVQISGYSGTGKTSLVDQIRPELLADRATMVTCKFSAQGLEQPTALLFQAFDTYCRDLIHNTAPFLFHEIKMAINDTFGSLLAVLVGRMPSLRYIVEDIEPFAGEAGNKTEEIDLIAYYFVKFVRTISGPRHPLVIFLDDLQWADQSCLDVVKMMLTDTSITSTLFLGSYRDEEVNATHPLAELLGAVAMDEVVPMSSISLGNLDKESVNELLSDCLHISQRFTRPLASALYSKTRGNPIFIRQLLISLSEDGSLSYSARDRRWQWDIQAIRAKSVADNAVDLIVSMIMCLDDDVRRLLRTAALLGWTFDTTILQRLLAPGSSTTSVANYIDIAVAGGLIVKDGSWLHFAHDAIWQGAFSLTPVSQREQTHLDLGRRLLSTTSTDDDLDACLFVIVGQYNKGASLVTSRDEALRLAELNLKAGKKALAATSFRQASIYLLQASVLLDPNDWDTHYDLCLRIFTTCGEVQLTQGNSDGALLSAAQVLNHGRALEDRLRSHHTIILANLSQDISAEQEHYNTAVQHGLAVLAELGESFPVDINQSVVNKERAKLIRIVAPRSVDDILQQRITDDPVKKAALKFLVIMTRMAYSKNQNLMLVLVYRMVEITMTSGLTSEASVAFASLSLALYGSGNHPLSDFCSRVSLALLQKFHQEHSQCAAFSLYFFVLPYKQPLQSCVDSLTRGFKDGMSVGDVEWALLCLRGATSISLFATERGKTLQEVEEEMMSNMKTLNAFRRSTFVSELSYAIAAVRNLMARTLDDTPADPTMLPEKSQPLHFVVLRMKICCQMWLTYLFRKYDDAAKIAHEYPDVEASNPFAPAASVINEQFYLGLLACAMQRREGSGSTKDDISKWRNVAAGVITKFSSWVKDGSAWNFEHKLDLLVAEQAYSDGNLVLATATYEKAVECSRKTSYINEEALCRERVGLFHQESGDVDAAKTYYETAITLYQSWGAKSKVADVEALLKGCG